VSETLTIDRDTLEEVRRALVSADSALSLLRYRTEPSIPWGSLGLLTKQECDERIGRARQAQQMLEAVLGPWQAGT
jgi:hypothetical protein